MPQLLSIQYLRALAALSVVVFHTSDRVHARFTIGAAGVDVFFVISGFIMWMISASNDAPPHRFMANRLRRIVPLYWTATIALASLAALAPTHLPSVKPSLDHALLSLFFIPHDNADGRIWPLVVPGWTLNYEMFFYAIFALVLLFSPRRRLILLSTVMVALVLIGKVWAFRSPIAATWTGQISLEFLAGAWLGWAWRAKLLPGRAAGVGLAAAGLAGFLADWALRLNGENYRLVTWGVPALLLVAGLVSVDADGGLPRFSLLKRLGDASYSIYLLPSLLIGVFMYVMRPLPPAVSVVLCVLTVAALGILSHRLLERPIDRMLRGWRFPADDCAQLLSRPRVHLSALTAVVYRRRGNSTES